MERSYCQIAQKVFYRCFRVPEERRGHSVRELWFAVGLQQTEGHGAVGGGPNSDDEIRQDAQRTEGVFDNFFLL